MPHGGTLTIRVCLETDGPRHWLLMEVSDTGEGIAPENRAKVFESFFTTKPEGKGTGLGLPICRRIMEGHRGSIQLISELGQGTTVQVRLPVQEGNASHGSAT